jgi:hypothetical protein
MVPWARFPVRGPADGLIFAVRAQERAKPPLIRYIMRH